MAWVELVVVLLWSVVLGLGSVAVTRCVRALPPFAGWTMQLKKPWACDICMTFWGVVGLASMAFWWGEPLRTLLFAGPCAWTVGFAVLRPLSAPTSLPPPFASLLPVDTGEETEDAGS